jgi:hypothetical protein
MTNFLNKIKHIILKRHVYGWSSPLRVLPDLIVIGVVRSGTTSLYHYLSQHPSIIKSAHDELGYFDSNYKLGLNWYKSFFPSIFEKKKIERKNGKFLTYDVTPFYIYNQKSSQRIHQILPNSKLIVILRNPIDRSYSNYFLGNQEKKFEEIIANEKKILNKIDKNNVDEYYNFVHTSMLARGFYAEQLENWYKIFPKDQILIIKSEEFATETNKIMNNIFDFLELPHYDIPDNSKKNKIHYKIMKKETRADLVEFFRPYNEKLYSLVGRNFDWEN